MWCAYLQQYSLQAWSACIKRTCMTWRVWQLEKHPWLPSWDNVKTQQITPIHKFNRCWMSQTPSLSWYLNYMSDLDCPRVLPQNSNRNKYSLPPAKCQVFYAANCGAIEGLLRCSRCRSALFCSLKCQKVCSLLVTLYKINCLATRHEYWVMFKCPKLVMMHCPKGIIHMSVAQLFFQLGVYHCLCSWYLNGSEMEGWPSSIIMQDSSQHIVCLAWVQPVSGKFSQIYSAAGILAVSQARVHPEWVCRCRRKFWAQICCLDEETW